MTTKGTKSAGKACQRRLRLSLSIFILQRIYSDVVIYLNLRLKGSEKSIPILVVFSEEEPTVGQVNISGRRF